MKKRLTFCGVLCLALLLFCGTALAADAQVTLKDQTVQVEQVAKGDDVAFKVTKTSGVQEGQLYLIMIQEGDDATAKPKPTKDNLYYLNVEPASAFPLEAYPKDLKADSSYVVYLSDYSAGSDGAAQGVALISTKSSGGNTPGGDNPGGEIGGDTPGGNNPGTDTPSGGSKLGDVNNDTYIDGSDAYLVMRIFGGLSNGNNAWTEAELTAANVNKDDYVDGSDALLIMQHFAGLLDDNFQRK